MKQNAQRIRTALSIVCLCVIVSGCSVEVDRPDKVPTTSELKGWRLKELAAVETAIRRRDFRLPGKVKGLAGRLGGLEINLTVGSGTKFKNPEEATRALARVVDRLKAWYERSLSRQQDSDEDLAELQTVVDEVKEVLRNIKAGD